MHQKLGHSKTHVTARQAVIGWASMRNAICPSLAGSITRKARCRVAIVTGRVPGHLRLGSYRRRKQADRGGGGSNMHAYRILAPNMWQTTRLSAGRIVRA